MARRLPSQPPNLPGFSYVRVLGSGGFADVFLYEQNLPRRQVAVKVLLAEVVTPQVRRMFQAEANVMAQLSAHPAVLTVYQASVSSDGRPYLVMELCSPALSQRYRADPVPVPDILRIGVKIASALETAHRAGVLHRDVKPSNILTTAYGHPVLSDFGIASTLGEAELTGVVGLSVPWSAPEVLSDETPGSVASEVWSLGATIYSLVAGSSPFEAIEGDNGSAELIARIQKAKPRPIERADVPASLTALLTKAMSKKPPARQSSVLEVIRDLQAVEAELALHQTPTDVAMDDWALATAADPEDRTRIKGILGTDPAERKRRKRRRAVASASQNGTRVRGVGSAAAFSGSAAREVSRWSNRTIAWMLVACAALVVALAAGATLVLVKTSTAANIPTVHDITGRTAGATIEFTWHDPGLANGDAYQVQVGTAPPSVQRSREFRVDATPGTQVCITVTVNRDGKMGQASPQKCIDPNEGT